MSYHPEVPYAGRPRADDADDAVELVAVLYEQKKASNAEIDARIADAIGVALSRNVSLRQLAKRLGVSPETIRRMGGPK